MPGDDEVDLLLRKIAERRQLMVDQIVQGGVPVDNVQSGYQNCVGYVRGLADAELLVREVFRGWLPDPPAKPKPKGIGDY